MGTCQYVKAYVGDCGRESGDAPFCGEHAGRECASCRDQATKECCYAGQFVCGTPLCADCEGFEEASKPSGAWGFLNHRHRRKVACDDPRLDASHTTEAGR